MDKIAILGASGHGQVIADLATDCGVKDVVFFDDKYPSLVENGMWPVGGTINDFFKSQSLFSGAVVGIGDNTTRLVLTNKLLSLSIEVPILIHPSAYVSKYAKLASGTIVMPKAAVNTGASIGIACIINTSCSIDHHCKLSDGVHISPGAHLAGNVTIGECSWIGIGSCIKQGINVASNAVVGAGACVIKEVAQNKTVIGIPAREKLTC